MEHFAGLGIVLLFVFGLPLVLTYVVFFYLRYLNRRAQRFAAYSDGMTGPDWNGTTYYDLDPHDPAHPVTPPREDGMEIVTAERLEAARKRIAAKRSQIEFTV